MDNAVLENYDYDKQQIKENITVDQMMEFLTELHAEPMIMGDVIVCRTICHGGSSHKLYYYANTQLFHCYTHCGETFDIFGLVQKVRSLDLPEDEEYPLPFAIEEVATFFGILPQINEEARKELQQNLEYWEVIKKYSRIKTTPQENKIVELKEYDDSFLKNLPHPLFETWLKDGISEQAMAEFEIAFDPVNCGIVIPHRDINDRLIGIRTRSLIKTQQELFGKYRPAYLNGRLYNHPLSYNLYGLNKNMENIKRMKKAIVFEAEKSVLQYETMFGRNNNIAVACCGSAFISYQAWLLINLGVDTIIIGFDHDFEDAQSAQAAKIIKNLTNIYTKYGHYVNIEMIWDRNNLTPLKASPTDCGKDIFYRLYKNRVNLYGGN